MTAYAFLDLDDTLFNSDRKAGPDRSRVAAVGRDGAPLSFQSAAQHRFLSDILGKAVPVPVTGRNRDALDRVRLTIPYRHAICSFGGLVLEDGRPHPGWRAIVAEGAEGAEKEMEALYARVRDCGSFWGTAVRHGVVWDDGLPLYLSVKSDDRDGAIVSTLAAIVHQKMPKGWKEHLNGNNLAYLPPFLGKERAVAWFLANVARDAELTLGVGDSHTDIAFMGLCDFAVTPTRHSQIFAALAAHHGASAP